MSTNAKLKSIVERIERLALEKADIQRDIADVYLEAKSHGFDVKILRMIIKQRSRGDAALAEEQSLIETYRAALGMTPIEEYILHNQDREKAA